MSAFRRAHRGALASPRRPDWLVPAVCAAVFSVVLAAAGTDDARRGLVFVGGPLLLLSGLHVRLEEYLHSPVRFASSTLPIAPADHFGAARPRHRRGLALTAVLGAAGIVIATVGRTSIEVALGLLTNFAVLWIAAWCVEPLVPAVSAWLGRRFPERTTAAELQRSVGGGWTLPETAVHLYAPAVGLGLAAALAMPIQLFVDLRSVGANPPLGLLGLGLALLLVAALSLLLAPRIYAGGMFEAVPWLHEATKTLAGPPVPEAVPKLVARVRDPVLRLILVQFWRQTPVPTLRLLALLGVAAWLCFGAAPPDLPRLTTLAAVTASWLVPARTIAAGRARRAAVTATLPVPQEQRAGRHRLAAWLLGAPVAVAMAAVLVRLGGLS